MVLNGPVTSGYPGTTGSLIFAGFMVMLFLASLITTKDRKDMYGKRDWQIVLYMGVTCGIFILMAIWGIWRHR